MDKERTFLIVDDDEDDLYFFEEALNKTDKSVRLIKVPESENALRVLNSTAKTPDIIFLDLNMPKKSGRECLVEIRKNAKLNSVPVIIYSTSSLASDKIELLKLGANHFITKFSDFGQLCKTLAAIIKNELTMEAPVRSLGR